MQSVRSKEKPLRCQLGNVRNKTGRDDFLPLIIITFPLEGKVKKFQKQLLSSVAILPLTMGIIAGAAAILAQNSLAIQSAYAASCNPCAAKKPCNPCNPCSGGAATECYVPRMKKAAACNPCAAKKPANPCNPCAAKKPCNPCNPCAAKKPANPCNPCAAKKPCNPCAAKKPCNPCNPCAAKKAANPCNPCAAKNPCAANPCNPCNPCAASAPDVELSAAEMKSLYDCLKPGLTKAYKSNGHWAANKWANWERFSKVGYRSDTHGGRFVQNYSNKIGAKAYGKYDATKKMPVGSTLAKPSFTVGADGRAAMGPLFIMEKMTRGWNKATSDWRYAMIMPGGKLFGMTKGKNSAGMKFCQDCHEGAEDNDLMFFMPEEYRR